MIERRTTFLIAQYLFLLTRKINPAVLPQKSLLIVSVLILADCLLHSQLRKFKQPEV